MKITPPISSTAVLPVPFTPEVQDAEKYKLTKTSAIRKGEQMLDREEQRIRAALAKAEDGSQDQDDLHEQLDAIQKGRDQSAVEWKVLEATVAGMKEKYPVPQVFFIAVPTSVEREQVNARLVSLGLTQVTQEQMRASTIEELFHQDWTFPGEEPDEDTNLARAEDHANFLDGCWMRSEAHDAAIRQWQEQEIERTIDEAEGAPARPRAELPPKIISVREAARMQLLVDRMMSTSQKLRDLAAANIDFHRRNAVLLVRMHVVGLEGFEPTVPLERDRRNGNALSEEAVNALREQVDDISWGQLVEHIDHLYKVDEAERKNSDSLQGKLSPLDGSIEPSDDQDSSDGISTDSSSTPVPDVASETTTAKSSGSTSGSGTTPRRKAKTSTPTVAP